MSVIRSLPRRDTQAYMLLAEQPERYSFYLTGNADPNLLNGEITRRLPLYQIATVYIKMRAVGVHIFRDDNPEVFSPP